MTRLVRTTTNSSTSITLAMEETPTTTKDRRNRKNHLKRSSSRQILNTIMGIRALEVSRSCHCHTFTRYRSRGCTRQRSHSIASLSPSRATCLFKERLFTRLLTCWESWGGGRAVAHLTRTSSDSATPKNPCSWAFGRTSTTPRLRRVSWRLMISSGVMRISLRQDSNGSKTFRSLWEC